MGQPFLAAAGFQPASPPMPRKDMIKSSFPSERSIRICWSSIVDKTVGIAKLKTGLMREIDGLLAVAGFRRDHVPEHEHGAVRRDFAAKRRRLCSRPIKEATGLDRYDDFSVNFSGINLLPCARSIRTRNRRRPIPTVLCRLSS